MLPRGIRCCNPLNIKEWAHDKTCWVGERATDDDPIFEEFAAMSYGIRAALIILRRYFLRYGLTTVEGIITRWSATDQHSYITTVCARMGVERDTPLAWSESVALGLIMAMSYVENGGDYLSEDDFKTAWEMLQEVRS